VSVLSSTERYVKGLGELGRSPLAASALVLAAELDDPGNSATSKSMCSKALLDVMNRLAELAPPVREADRLDEVKAARARRRANS
jgi:hypothetical protein